MLATSLFNHLDQDSNGTLDIDEFVPYLYGTAQPEQADEEIVKRNKEAMARVDTNGDGQVNLQEWIKWLQREWLLERYKSATSM